MLISGAGGDGLNRFYKPLTPIYFTFAIIWVLSAISWTFNTYRNRQFQPNKLQWILASVPWIKALQISLSFLFWYSCLYTDECSLWISFGIYVSGVLVKTSAFVSFFLISHGYCITCHRLPLTERQTMASLGCVFYLTLVGFRVSIPYFSVLLLLNYLILFYVIFNHISQNLIALREQLNLTEDEDVLAMHDPVYTKYIMFKKFQGAMHIVAVLELVIFLSMHKSLENYWIRMLVREWAEFFIFVYIGWVFRSQQLAPRFSVMPTLRSNGMTVAPPIYSIEMDAKTFREFRSHEWKIGVPTLPCKGSLKDSVLVVIRQPYRCSSPTNSQCT